MTPWFERYPARLSFELAELDEEGWAYQIVEKFKEQGQIVLTVNAVVDGQHVELVVYYPDTYPKTRMEVFAPQLHLKRHQNPFGKNLCLLDAGTIHWRTTDTLVSILKSQLPLVLKIGAADDPAAYKDEEVPQGEPISVFYPSHPGDCLFIDSQWHIESDEKDGRLEVRFQTLGHPVRGVVSKVFAGQNELARAADAITMSYPHVASGYWIRWDHALPEPNPTAVLRAILQYKPGWGAKKAPAVFGLLVREELNQGVFGDGWLFVVKATNGQTFLIRGRRAGLSDLTARVPDLKPMPSKVASVVGLGSLGAPIALELARASIGTLKVADFDDVEAGSVCRWPLGLSAAGKYKTAAIAEFVRLNYPYTNVQEFLAGIGRVSQPLGSEYSDRQSLEQLVESDLLIDASAEMGVQNILSDIAWEMEIPYILVEGNAGMWGGLVARFIPGKTGCWLCLQRRIEANEIALAPGSSEPGIQPPGCGNPTFTGSGFDAISVATSATRLAVQTLCASEGGYSDATFDVLVIALRDSSGKAIAPNFTPYAHPPCPGCCG
jgi:hypothetical protein